MSTTTVKKTYKNVTIDLVIREASIGDDMRRGLLVGKAIDEPLPDQADQMVAVSVYPRCMAVLVEGTIVEGEITRDAKTLTPAEFVALPAPLGDAWFDAVLEINEHWDASRIRAEDPAHEKKD